MSAHTPPHRRASAMVILLVILVSCSAVKDRATTTDHATTAHSAGDHSASSQSVVASASPPSSSAATPAITPTTSASTPFTSSAVTTITGMPSVVDATNLYSEAAAGKLSPAVANAKSYVYVPSDSDGTITVIDQASMQVIDNFGTGAKLVQHVVPSYDLKTLYANVSGGNNLLSIDPTTGKPGKAIAVDAPYNLYFTPDGTRAIVMAERLDRIDFYSLPDWKKVHSTKVPCKSRVKGMSFGGVNHADWSIDGKYFLATCEFAGDMIKVDTQTMDVVGSVHLRDGAMPQDVRITPDGKKFYVADMMSDGVWILDGETMTVTGKIETGRGTHGLYPSRDGSVFYAANRGRHMDDTGRKSRPGEGSVSVIDWRTDAVIANWEIPGGGSPDMGGVSADGSTLWLAGRYDSEVYAFDTTNGSLKGRVKVAREPHGLCVFPQPGRYSLGHTGNYR